jgi:hypothetical protein
VSDRKNSMQDKHARQHRLEECMDKERGNTPHGTPRWPPAWHINIANLYTKKTYQQELHVLVLFGARGLGRGLDALSQHVVAHVIQDARCMLLLGVDPANRLMPDVRCPRTYVVNGRPRVALASRA